MKREVLSTAVAQAVLSAKDPSGQSLWARLEAARSELAAVVDACNQLLNGNPLMPVLATRIHKDAGGRGARAILLVQPDGVVMLESEEWASKLPSLEALREEGARLGFDVGSFGRSKQNLLKAIQQARSGAPIPAVKSPTVKPPVVKPPTPDEAKIIPDVVVLAPSTFVPEEIIVDEDVVSEEDDVHAPPPEEDDEDLTDLFASMPKKPLQPPSPSPSSTAPLKTFSGRSLSALAAAAAEEVNLAEVLARPPPPLPKD